ncbi:hypothetical protein BC830DRAFT_1134730 [Chytriomyces sp. MP71]|nr:hypothetical protein BC830DRAFT_1134730 [Chytriomyces sp. MP71]
MMFYNEKRVCDAIPCAHTRNPAPRSRSPRIHSDTSSHSYTVPRTPNVPTPTTSPAPNRSISSTPQPGPPKSFRNSTVRDSEGAGEEEQEMEVEARVSQIECVVDGYSEDESGEEEPGYQLRVEIETKPRSLDSLQSESVSDSESQSEECSLNCRKYSKFCVDLRDESDLDHDEESEDEEDEMEEEEDPLSESEWDEDMKRPTGPRTHRFFGQAYSKFIKRDWRMSSGTHRYDFSRKDGERTFPNQNAPSGGFKEHHLKPGNFVELMWPEEVEDFVTKKYYARVSDVTEHGIRVLQLYFPNQSFLRAAGNMLDQKLLFQSSVCECEHGWIKFSQVLRIVSVFYGNRLEGNAEFFVPFFYCLDNFSFFNVPDAFLDPNSKPRDLCLCPNTRNSDRWPETTEQKKSAHLIGTAMKRQFQPGEFYGFIMPPSSASEPPLDAVIEIISFSRGNAVVNDEENGDDTFYADPPVLRIRMFETLHESSMPNELRWRDNEYELVGWNEIARVSHPVFVEFWDGQAPSQAVRYKGAGSRVIDTFYIMSHLICIDSSSSRICRKRLRIIQFMDFKGVA